ncbi:MAG: hypothetical protein KDA52_03440 [Planctomycetaceae bacterium]|nr:hypothetical protein [Planctomycetaceae bacterium]
MLNRIPLLLVACILGCGQTDGPPPNVSISEGGATLEVDTHLVNALCDRVKDALAEKEWEKLDQLHWSGSPHTPESLQANYAPLLAKIAKVELVNVGSHNNYDATSFDTFIDEEEIPGPKELLRGDVEFFVGSTDVPDSLLIWVFLCEEDQQLKIFDYIELSLER